MSSARPSDWGGLRPGIVVARSQPLAETLGLDASTRHVLFAVEDARALKFPTALRWLGRVGCLAFGAALIDARIVAATWVGTGEPRAGAGAGLVVYAGDRNESLVLMGIEVVEIVTAPAPARPGLAMADVAMLFDEVERCTWQLRHSNRPAEERRSS